MARTWCSAVQRSILCLTVSGSLVRCLAQDPLRLSVAEISATATFRSYHYAARSKVIRFFVVKAPSGSVKAAFDACEVCYPANKGYSQSGAYMVCNNCGRRFLVTELGTGNLTGGCWPSHLPGTVEGGFLTISTADLVKGDKFFPVTAAAAGSPDPHLAPAPRIDIRYVGDGLPEFHATGGQGVLEVSVRRLDGGTAAQARHTIAPGKPLRLRLDQSGLPAGSYLIRVGTGGSGQPLWQGATRLF